MESELLCINKLQGSENWYVWKFQIIVILKSYRLWNVVKVVQVMPTMLDNNASVAEKKEYEKKKSDFKKADGTAQRVIVTTLTEKNHDSSCASRKCQRNVGKTCVCV